MSEQISLTYFSQRIRLLFDLFNVFMIIITISQFKLLWTVKFGMK